MSLDYTEKTEKFNHAEKEYRRARSEQSEILYEYFSQFPDFRINSKRVGKGRTNYTSGKRLTIPYDLSNWQYVELERKNMKFFISFQPFDQDPSSKNYHVLFDRIGIYAYVGKYSSRDAFRQMMITDISLPFTEEKLDTLRDIIMKLSECEPFQAEFQEICRENHLFISCI